jgi:surfeit locus 1 family protein
VRVEGHYEPAQQILLDNMPSQAGLPGFRVLTPFRRSGSERLLLVDRGWVPLGATRQELPAVFVSPEFRAVSGRLDTLPAPGVRVGDAGVADDTSWPRVLNFPQQPDIEKALGAKVEARIILLDPAAPNGYERVWRPAMRFGPERHLGYAIQWFALAIVALVIFLALSLRRVPGDAPAATNSTSGSP